MMPVDKAEFRRALGHFAAGVTVVTSRAEDGALAGITVTAFSSLSLEPPLVLVCIDKRAKIHDRLKLGGNFAVNMLRDDQELISRRFASSQGDQFQEIGYSLGMSGAPVLEDVISAVECRITSLLDGGDHTIVVGEVEASHVREGKPLLYFRGGYSQIA
jgi:flavin reductase (DIM6/NTAB) family NADH-FMN oxidoreductase RutF